MKKTKTPELPDGPYKIIAKGFLASPISEGEFKDIPLAVCLAFQEDILQKKLTADNIRKRGWEFV
jgi:hypothetical protein